MDHQIHWEDIHGNRPADDAWWGADCQAGTKLGFEPISAVAAFNPKIRASVNSFKRIA